MHLVKFLADISRSQNDRTAFTHGSENITFQELERLSNGLAESLIAMGISFGDRVALILENSPKFAVCYFGIIKAGAVAVPLDTKYKLIELESVFGDCEPAAVIAERPAISLLRSKSLVFKSIRHFICIQESDDVDIICYDSLVKQEPAAPAVSAYPEIAHIAYTSGPTLRPHGVEITQKALVEAAAGAAVGFRQNENDIAVLFALPLHHTMGIAIIMMTSLYAGSRIVMVNGISIDNAFGAIEREGATMFHGVPFIHAMVVKHLRANGLTYDLSSLRFCGSAGAPIPVSVITEFESMTGKNLIQYYGLTESTTHVTCQDTSSSGRSGGVGWAIPGFAVRVVDENGRETAVGEPGEIIISGPIMRAFHNLPRETERFIREGWFYTDDIGFIDPNGELFILGVKKPMLITKGQNIYFSDISDVLLKHPLVEDAAAAGIPDPDEMRGEVVLAAVKLKPGAAMTEQQVKKYCLDKLANYKCPKKVIIVDTVPRNGKGQLAVDHLSEI